MSVSGILFSLVLVVLSIVYVAYVIAVNFQKKRLGL